MFILKKVAGRNTLILLIQRLNKCFMIVNIVEINVPKFEVTAEMIHEA